ncbi:hypothetical protein GPJ56_005496 [Histomonas meleagridis]|uniref:uncharacterized protein n=1 Tax=Histomonas meleagridis TaxID=135588 RepID=UPI003559A7A7|nr:hypothetical protein GPJ56_005496 [Histomonas meleagridis]KAH0802520.1 hypothetical protein GO595_004569 [Histomonas meleagridis]
MALHSVDYHLKTNERYMNEMEKTRPIQSQDMDLINKSFRQEYIKPIYDWTLIQSTKKRNKLYSLLRGELHDETSKVNNFQPTTRADLVIQTTTGVFDFNKAIFGPTPPLKTGSNRFQKSQIKDVFNPEKKEPPAQTPKTDAKRSYTIFIMKKLLKPSVAEKLINCAGAAESLMNELLIWTEKKSNQYPINPIPRTSQLDPINEGKLTKETLKQDHIYTPDHTTIKPVQCAGSRLKTRSVNCLFRTNYQNTFCDEIHNQKFKPTRPIPQLKRPIPFDLSPTVKREKLEFNADLYNSQSIMNRELGRTNKAIYNSKTSIT